MMRPVNPAVWRASLGLLSYLLVTWLLEGRAPWTS